MGYNLISGKNFKTNKGRKFGYHTAILHLAPSDLSGYNVCPMATLGCRAACLNTSGQGGMIKGSAGMCGSDLVTAIKSGQLTNRVQLARIRKTRQFMECRAEFMALLVKDIIAHIRVSKKHGLTPCIRLNGTSDLRWETVKINGKTIFEIFPDIIFYDYTKIANRKVSHIPNYHLTFSLAEDNDASAREAIENGMSVAVVFRKLPETFMDCKVVDGDVSDLRFLEPAGLIVGLTAKAKAKKDTTGFVRG